MIIQTDIRQTSIRLFLTCWLIYSLHFATNIVREIYPALSLGDDFSFNVQEYLGFHPDIFEIPGRGAYINNNPGASILGAIPYTLAKPAIDRVVEAVQTRRSTGEVDPPEYDSIYPLAQEFYLKAHQSGLDVKFGLAAGVMQAFLMAPLSAFSVVLMFLVLFYRIRMKRAALWLAILYGFATPIFYRTAQLNQNLLQAHFAFFAFAIIWRPWDQTTLQRPKYWLAGLLASWTVLLDYSGIIILCAIFVYAFLRRKSLPQTAKKEYDLLEFLLAASLGLLILIAYQWLAFGHPFYPAQYYMPPTRFSSSGFNGITWPQIELLFENAFSIRFGLFLSAPILILALIFPLWRKDSRRITGNLETGFIIAFALAFFLFTAANQYSRMQFNSGVRHLIPVVPFLFFLVASVLLRMPRWLAIGIGVLSTYWSWCLAMYRDVEQGRGIFESIINITTGGFQLPWFMTLQRLGMLPSWVSVNVIILISSILIIVIWYNPTRSLVKK